MKKCPHCGSESVWYFGTRNVEYGKDEEVWMCDNCDRATVDPDCRRRWRIGDAPEAERREPGP